MDYSRSARIQAMQHAGWPSATIPLAVAISMAEWGGTGSGINNTAYPDRPYYHPVNTARGDSPEYSAGPWQINLLAHPDVSVEQAMDLNYSTKFARDLSRNGTNFTPWGSFTDGRYRSFFNTTGNDATGTPATTPTDRPSNRLGLGRAKERTLASTPVGDVKIRPDVGLFVKLGATGLAVLLIVSGALSFAKKG